MSQPPRPPKPPKPPGPQSPQEPKAPPKPPGLQSSPSLEQLNIPSIPKASLSSDEVSQGEASSAKPAGGTITFLPDSVTVAIDPATTIREAAHGAGVNVHDRCGGMGACCNCIVTLKEGAEFVTAKTLVEEAVFYLDSQDRLSCQCHVKGGHVVVETLSATLSQFQS